VSVLASTHLGTGPVPQRALRRRSKQKFPMSAKLSFPTRHV